jgi:hypothetical protein
VRRSHWIKVETTPAIIKMMDDYAKKFIKEAPAKAPVEPVDENPFAILTNSDDAAEVEEEIHCQAEEFHCQAEEFLRHESLLQLQQHHHC